MNATNEPAIQTAIEEVDELGYGIIRNHVDAERVEELLHLYESLAKPVEVDGVPSKNIRSNKNLVTQTRDLDDLITDPCMLDVMTHILGPLGRWGLKVSDVGLKNSRAAGAVPKTTGRPFHGMHTDDSVYPIRSPVQPLTANAILALEPFEKDVGATRFVPGSHRWDKPVDPDHETVSVSMQPGDMVIFGGKTWHASGKNLTVDRQRRAVNFYYCIGWCLPVHGHACGMSEAEVKQLPAALQALL